MAKPISVGNVPDRFVAVRSRYTVDPDSVVENSKTNRMRVLVCARGKVKS